MVRFSLFLWLAISMAITPAAHGQHTDVQFSYVENKIVVLPDAGVEHLIFESNFPTSGIEQQFATLPGLASETDVGFGIGPRDEIIYNVLDNLLYFDGSDLAAPPAGYEIRIRNNPPSVPDTLVTVNSGEQLGSTTPPRNRIGAAGSTGDFHVDLQWRLQPNDFPSPPPPEAFGAYGVLLTLGTSAPGIEDSDPLLFTFNFGLDDSGFEEAVAAFTTLLIAPALPADFDADGNVDNDDFAIWQMHLGSHDATASTGDTDGDGDVDGNDFLVVQASFGTNAGAAAVTVPEPAAGCLVLATALFLLATRARPTRLT